MGGYSEKCLYCDKWFISSPKAISDHVKVKHPNKHEEWKKIREEFGPNWGQLNYSIKE